MAKLDLEVLVGVKGARALNGLAGDLDGIGRSLLNVGTIVAGAGAAVGGIGVLTAGFASDLNESMSKVNVVFGDSADEIVAWSEDAAKAFGLSQQAALESVGTFGNLFDSMGATTDESKGMSRELVQLASDLASFNNISIDEALIKLRAGLVGEAEPLRTLGVNISAAATEAKALELGLVGPGEELTALAKAQANYAIIMEQTTNAQGDFARTSDGMANQQRILAATFQDTMADIGQAFVPIIEAILPTVITLLQGFGDWVSGNGPAIGDVLKGVATGIGTAFAFIGDVVIPGLVAVFTWFTTNVLPGLLAAFEGIRAWVIANWPTISAVINQAVGAISNALKVIIPIIMRIANVLFPALGAAGSVLFSVLDVAFRGIGGAFEVIGTVVSTVVDAIVAAWDFLMDMFRDAVRAFERIGDRIFAPIGEGFEAAIGFIKGIWNAFARWWNGIEISVPSIDIPFVGKVGGFTIGLPDLPMLAEGGIVTGPTLALLGEKGDEAVVPLDRGGMGNTVINVDVTTVEPMTEEGTARMIDRVLWVNNLTDRVTVTG